MVKKKSKAVSKETPATLTYEDRLAWFHEARFGLFIHWGLYSLLERGEWAMFQERIPRDDYAKLADRFRPKHFNPHAWAEMARDAGMKYAVLTTRHHDGFCLFDSQVSEFTAPKTAAKRDLVAEYVEAFRKAGLKVGFYYSLLDWRFPGYFMPTKYKKSAADMVAQFHAQVRELMTNYGHIDVLWYDGGWIAHGAYAKDIAAFWKSAEVNAMARELQPHIVINNRSGIDEDLDTPEQHVTASQAGRGWESCMTIGDSCGWGYIRNNPNMKTVTQLLQHLVTAAAGEGNFLLNVGPRPDGTIRKGERKRLAAMGEWLKVNGEAIYGSQRCSLHGGMIGMWTRKGNTGYLHVLRWPGKEAVVPLVKTAVKSARLLATGDRLQVRQEHNGRLVIGGLPKSPPDPHIAVIKVKFDGPPESLDERDKAAWIEAQAE
ncbi:MAG TPA: alpha-L-fucosidase [Candidatus Hydrogenedentes bacterium]|nr:alpha-L-fucosidase [Candidatus Hydrogenedentota bacterium]HPG68623.1 alpha-L-fucosidase [Candidatus Hydrogenedentota bacterium]